MKKGLKILLVAAAVLVAVIVIGAVAVYSNLDRIVRIATEKAMAYALDVPVTVGGAKVKPTEGLIEFHEIVIPNPPGYKTDRAMRFGLVRAQADLKSFRTDEPLIRLIQVSGAEITMEAKKEGSNLEALIKNAQRLAPKDAEEPPPQEESQKAVKIERVLVEGAKARVAIPYMDGKTVDLKLPKIEMTDLGGKKEKVTPAEALEQFLAGILDGIRSAGAGLLPDDLTRQIGDTLKGLPGNVTQGLGEAGKTVEGAAKEAGGAVKSVGKELEGLLGGRKKDEKK